MSLRQKGKKKSTQTRTAVAPGFRKIPACAPTNSVWRQVGIPAGAEGASPSKNHAYGHGERHALSVSSSGRFPPNRRWNCVICGESAGENESPEMSQRVASPCARRRRTQACNAGCGRETRRKINGQGNGGGKGDAGTVCLAAAKSAPCYCIQTHFHGLRCPPPPLVLLHLFGLISCFARGFHGDCCM